MSNTVHPRSCVRCGFRPRAVLVDRTAVVDAHHGKAPRVRARFAVVEAPLCHECEREEAAAFSADVG